MDVLELPESSKDALEVLMRWYVVGVACVGLMCSFICLACSSSDGCDVAEFF